jgi:tetratricopeptide (TPR) repeat protein
LQHAVELEPTSVATQAVLARPLIALRKYQHVIDMLGKVPADQRPDEVASLLAVAYANAGERNRAEALLKVLENRQVQSPGSLARLYIGLGDLNGAFAALDQAIEQRSDLISVLKVSPLFDPLRPDARFNALLRRANFP